MRWLAIALALAANGRRSFGRDLIQRCRLRSNRSRAGRTAESSKAYAHRNRLFPLAKVRGVVGGDAQFERAAPRLEFGEPEPADAGNEAEAAQGAGDDLEREVDFASTDDIPDEPRAALGWFTRAAAHHHVMALNMVGRCYDLRWGTAPDTSMWKTETLLPFWTAAIGWILCARRIVAGLASESPSARTLPTSTRRFIAPTVSSIGTLRSTRCW